jgi:5-methylthioadenosine/S-adenosylhomocysteine deaminase
VEPDCSVLAGRQDEVGTIEVGKRADLMLIALDEVTHEVVRIRRRGRRQLRDAAAVHTVFIDGRVKSWGRARRG